LDLPLNLDLSLDLSLDLDLDLDLNLSLDLDLSLVVVAEDVRPERFAVQVANLAVPVASPAEDAVVRLIPKTSKPI
jgi:hypothetical protein